MCCLTWHLVLVRLLLAGAGQPGVAGAPPVGVVCGELREGEPGAGPRAAAALPLSPLAPPLAGVLRSPAVSNRVGSAHPCCQHPTEAPVLASALSPNHANSHFVPVSLTKQEPTTGNNRGKLLIVSDSLSTKLQPDPGERPLCK